MMTSHRSIYYMVAEEIRNDYLRSIRSDIGGDNVEGVGNFGCADG
jgi:hypothetical protein